MRIKLQMPSPSIAVSFTALLISLGSAAYAANTVFSIDIVDGEVRSADIANLAVTNAKLANNSINSAKVVDNSITADDLKGANVLGAVNVTGGAIPNGRCADISTTVVGAVAGEVVVLSLRGPAPAGMLFVGIRISAANTMIMKVCNFTGGANPAISNLPVHVMTFG